MPDPLIIATLISTLVGGIIACFQSYLDYKRDHLNNHNGLYEMKTFQSNCCSTVIESDSDNNQASI